jgi:3-methyladenine DNA glycosylase AlkD
MSDRHPYDDWTATDIGSWLADHRSDRNIAGMARYGIRTDTALGIPNAELRPLARKLGRNHERALALWASGVREARLLACFTEVPKAITLAQAREWAGDFNSWEIVDHAADLFANSPLADRLIEEFVADEREFVRRAGFAMMAWAAVHWKNRSDSDFDGWLEHIENHAADQRNFVRKAVNWALRQIGKRSLPLHDKALELTQRLAASDDRTERWVGRDAVRELTSRKTIERLNRKKR